MSAEVLRRAAAEMRAAHGPDHERHLMWAAMADWLETEADAHDPTSPDVKCNVDDDSDLSWLAAACMKSPGLVVARAYLDELA